MPAHAEPHHSRQGRRSKALGEGTRGKQGTRNMHNAMRISAMPAANWRSATGAWGSGRWSGEGSLSPLTATGNSAMLCW